MVYIREFRDSWRALIAAILGMSAGYTINNYLNNIFIPHLMEEFGWTSQSIALIGVTVVLSALFQPIAGRLADRYGPRTVAFVGVVSVPAIYVAYGMMQGAIEVFFILNALQIVLVAATTGVVVYSRSIARSFDRALGLALSLATCAPALAGALFVPLLSAFIDSFGWRAGYFATAAVTLIVGSAAICLLPGERKEKQVVQRAPHNTKNELLALIKDWRFIFIIASMILCNLSVMMQVTQLKVIFLNQSVDSGTATTLISIYATGVIVGRLLCGLLLDRFPAHIVSSLAMGLPAAGLMILASGTSGIALLTASAILLGFSMGAEGDIAAFLVRRVFPIRIYSMVLGFAMGAIAFGGAFGSVVLSVLLDLTGSFVPFLTLAAFTAIIGSLLLFALNALPETPEPVPAGNR